MNLPDDAARCYGNGEKVCDLCARRLQMYRDEKRMKDVRYSVWIGYIQPMAQGMDCANYIKERG